MELESQREKLEARGLRLAAVSYDSIEILQDFAARKGIHFPLLTDPGSEVIRRFGLLNTSVAEGEMSFGIPHPVTFVTDEKDVIQSKLMEEGYVPRQTAASYLTVTGDTPHAAVSELSTPFFRLRTAASNAEVVPGSHITLVLDFTLAEGLHAYAPGDHDYRPLKLTFEPNPFVTLHEPRYPPSKPFHFAPLHETVPVFEGGFRLSQDVTITFPDREAMTKFFQEGDGKLTLAASLGYQVCSATVCHPPAQLPVAWTLQVRPLDFERSPEAMRHKAKKGD